MPTSSAADRGQSNQYENQTNQQLKFVPKLKDCPGESSVYFTDGIFNLCGFLNLFMYYVYI